MINIQPIPSLSIVTAKPRPYIVQVAINPSTYLPKKFLILSEKLLILERHVVLCNIKKHQQSFGFPTYKAEHNTIRYIISTKRPEITVNAIVNTVAFLFVHGYFSFKGKLPVNHTSAFSVIMETFNLLLFRGFTFKEGFVKRYPQLVDRCSTLSSLFESILLTDTNKKPLPRNAVYLYRCVQWQLERFSSPVKIHRLTSLTSAWHKTTPNEFISEREIRLEQLISVKSISRRTIRNFLRDNSFFFQGVQFKNITQPLNKHRYNFLEVEERFIDIANTLQFLHHKYGHNSIDTPDVAPSCGCYMLIRSNHGGSGVTYKKIRRGKHYETKEDRHYLLLSSRFHRFIVNQHVLRLCCSPWISRINPLPVHPWITTLMLRGEAAEQKCALECFFRLLFAVDGYHINSKDADNGRMAMPLTDDPLTPKLPLLLVDLINLWPDHKSLATSIDSTIKDLLSEYRKRKRDLTETRVRVTRTEKKRACLNKGTVRYYSEHVMEEREITDSEVLMEEKREEFKVYRYGCSWAYNDKPSLVRAIHGFLEWRLPHFITLGSLRILQRFLLHQKYNSHILLSHMIDGICDRWKREDDSKPILIPRSCGKDYQDGLYYLYNLLSHPALPRTQAQNIFMDIYTCTDTKGAPRKIRFVMGGKKFGSASLAKFERLRIFDNYYEGKPQFVGEDLHLIHKKDECMRTVPRDGVAVDKLNYVVYLFERYRYDLKDVERFPFVRVDKSLKMNNPLFPILVLDHCNENRKSIPTCSVSYPPYIFPFLSVNFSNDPHPREDVHSTGYVNKSESLLTKRCLEEFYLLTKPLTTLIHSTVS